MPTEAVKMVEEKLEKLDVELSQNLRRLEIASRSVSRQYSRLLLFKNMLKEIFSFSNLRVVPLLLKLSGIASPVIGAYLSFHTLPIQATIIIVSLILVLEGLLLRNYVIREMTSFGGKYFHFGAYEKYKKEEFLMLYPFIGEDFKKLKENYTSTTVEMAERIQAVEGENKQYQVKLEESERVLEELVHSLLETEKNLDFMESKYEMVNEFLYKLKDNLSLLVRNKLDLQNLDFGVHYSIYSLQEDGIQLEEVFGFNRDDVPGFIFLDEWDHPFIEALGVTPSNHLYEKDKLISWSLHLEGGQKWVVNLHLDERNKDKLNPASEHGKINIKITQELLWICCELLNKFSMMESYKEQGRESVTDGL